MQGSQYSDDEYRTHRRRKERPQLNVPVSAGSHRRDDLVKLARRNLRRPNPSTMSRDTTQSRFQCLYTDCGWTGHADENAARGEIVIVLAGAVEHVTGEDERTAKQMVGVLSRHVSKSDAIKIAAELSGVTRDVLYRIVHDSDAG